MVFGRSLARRLRPALTAVACAIAASLAAPVFAQIPAPPAAPPQAAPLKTATAPAAPPQTAQQKAAAAKSDPAGRVPVEGAPRSMDSELNRLLVREPLPTSLFEARRQASRAADTIAKLLEADGYYAAIVQPQAEGVDSFHRKVKVTIGPLFTIAGRSIVLDEGKLDPVTQRDIEALLQPLDLGVPARTQPVLDVEDTILRKLKRSGYPDARANTIDALADGEAQTLEYTFHIVPGARTSFGKLNIEGLGLTHREFIQRLQPWGENERYSETKLEEMRARLAETGLFASAGAALSPQAQPQPQPGGAAETVTRDVDVKLIERERQTIALGASASTSEGIGLNGQWDLRNWSGWGDTVTVSGQLASLQSFLEADYRLPNIDHYGRNLKLFAKAENSQTDAYDQNAATLGATLEERLTPRLRGSIGIEGGYASIADEQARAMGRDRRDLWLVDVLGTAEYTGVRDILDPVDGLRARITVEPGATFGDTTIGYTRLSGEASVYATLFTKNLVGAVRGKLGAILGPNGAPPDKVFFAGGGGSVRGYDYQSLSPRDANNVPVGGRSLVETSFELRYRFTDTLGAVAFIDAGAAGDDVNPPFNAMRAGAGFGLRYYTGFGPLRADIAAPLNKRTGDSDFQIYISIGQAF